MNRREECRNCGATLKHDKTSGQYDPEYCSGKCRREDGSEPYVKTVAEQAMVVQATHKALPASLKDYKKNVGGKYTLRFDPEKLNWGNPLSPSELAQGGFRANREPILGDWDYQVDAEAVEESTEVEMKEEGVTATVTVTKPLNEWQALLAKAKELGIATHGKKRFELEDAIKEAENVG